VPSRLGARRCCDSVPAAVLAEVEGSIGIRQQLGFGKVKLRESRHNVASQRNIFSRSILGIDLSPNLCREPRISSQRLGTGKSRVLGRTAGPGVLSYREHA